MAIYIYIYTYASKQVCLNTVDCFFFKNQVKTFKSSHLWIKLVTKKPYISPSATNNLTQSLKMTSEMVESPQANIGFFLYQLDLDVRKLKHLHLILKKKQSMVFNQTCLEIYIK